MVQVIRDIFREFTLPIRNDEKIEEYRINDLTEEAYKRLSQIISLSECIYFNAVCGELLWDHYHEPKYAEIALDNYEIGRAHV